MGFDAHSSVDREAAATGHQVFSTLHTNSAIATALEAIIAQRLVRRICPECRQTVPADALLLKKLGNKFQNGMTHCSKGAGCQNCYHTGYKGRVGLYEVLSLNDRLHHLIANRAAVTEIIAYASEQGFVSLRDEAFQKVQVSAATLEEVLRVLGPE